MTLKIAAIKTAHLSLNKHRKLADNMACNNGVL